MLKPESKQAVSNFFAAAETEFNAFLKARSPEEYEAAAQLILDSQAKGGRLHVTGIGKCSHVSTYAASLFSSTGNPAYYLHGTEAVHGSCGQLAAGDVVIAISNSGETAELKATVLAVQNNGCKVTLDTIQKPDKELKDKLEVLEFGLEHERYVTGLIHNIYEAAQAAKDFRTTQFLDWFVKEQGEEEKNAEDMIKKMKLFGDDAKGLYMLNSEMAARVYSAPSLVL